VRSRRSSGEAVTTSTSPVGLRAAPVGQQQPRGSRGVGRALGRQLDRELRRVRLSKAVVRARARGRPLRSGLVRSDGVLCSVAWKREAGAVQRCVRSPRGEMQKDARSASRVAYLAGESYPASRMQWRRYRSTNRSRDCSGRPGQGWLVEDCEDAPERVVDLTCQRTARPCPIEFTRFLPGPPA
jgi:hypothetical protein